jgi:hypothetical protein
VLVHTGKRAAESALTLDAEAYSVGRHVVFGDGAFAPHTSTGRRLLAHELTHVAQRSDGAHGDHDAAESEAANVADTLAHGRAASPVRSRVAPHVVHRQPKAKPKAEGPDDDPNFMAWWKNVPGAEGPKSDDPDDPGGQTRWGVTREIFFGNCKSVLHVDPTQALFDALSPEQAKLFG